MFTKGFKTAAFDHNNQGLEFKMSDMGNPMIGPGGMGPSGDETYQPLGAKEKALMKHKKRSKQELAQLVYEKLGSGMEDAALSSGGGGSDIASTLATQAKYTFQNGPDLEAEADDRKEQKNRYKKIKRLVK